MMVIASVLAFIGHVYVRSCISVAVRVLLFCIRSGIDRKDGERPQGHLEDTGVEQLKQARGLILQYSFLHFAIQVP